MPAERPISKASENRRATKPIMEKRRRARINHCLSELKTLILDALNKDPSRHSKLEKADILEMTVRHLQNIQRQQMAASISGDVSIGNKFEAGFSECASEVNRYVSAVEGLDPALRQRLLSHLAQCIQPQHKNSTVSQSSVLPSLIPSRLPSGELAFVLSPAWPRPPLSPLSPTSSESDGVFTVEHFTHQPISPPPSGRRHHSSTDSQDNVWRPW